MLRVPEGRSPIAIGFEWASRISIAGVTFFLPILAGHWLDRRLGSAPLGLIGGIMLGFAVGVIQLVQIARDSSQIKP